jgi:predicted AAA+ superfamily ATPase
MQYLKRKSYLELKKHLEKKEISLILGPRQAGKTTLMFHLQQELKEKKNPHFLFQS